MAANSGSSNPNNSLGGASGQSPSIQALDRELARQLMINDAAGQPGSEANISSHSLNLQNQIMGSNNSNANSSANAGAGGGGANNASGSGNSGSERLYK